MTQFLDFHWLSMTRNADETRLWAKANGVPQTQVIHATTTSVEGMRMNMFAIHRSRSFYDRRDWQRIERVVSDNLRKSRLPQMTVFDDSQGPSVAGCTCFNPDCRAHRFTPVGGLSATRILYGIEDLLVGLGPDETVMTWMSFRDAEDHVTAYVHSDTEALALLKRADQTGDELLARAVGNAAVSGQGYPLTAREYLAQRSTKRAALAAVQQSLLKAG